ADPVSGWTQHAGNVYKATASLPITGHADTGFLANQVFVNNEMMIEARWPNVSNGSDGRDLMNPQFAGGGVSSPSGLDAVVSNESIPTIAESWLGATVWTSEWYTSRTGTITGVVPGSNGKSLNAIMSAAWERGGFWFYLSNKLGLLDTPREWFYDGTTLYLWAPNGATPSGVEVKQRNEAFDLSDRSHIVIRDIALFAATITTSNQSAGVVIDNIDARYVSHHATLPRPPISEWSGNVPSDGDFWLSSHAHDTGIQLRGQGHTLKNSRISWSSGNGVLLEGRDHLVSNNVIENTNYMVSYAASVRINGKSHRIVHNTIRRTARDALIVDWHTTNYDFSNSEIAYNDISRFGMLSTDLGAIYICCYIDMRGTSIHHNHIREGYGFSP
ncbi:MAG: right-handed parallel beta-helix repeat-containing protein, partial [Casimicrobium sp.]